MTTLPELLSVDQMAELLDCTPETVEDRTRDRTLPGLKFGRRWVYPRDAVLEVLHRQALAHVAPPPSVPPAPAQSARPVSVIPMPARRRRGQSPAPLPDPPIQRPAP